MNAQTIAELNQLADEIRSRFASTEESFIESDLVILGRKKSGACICKTIAKPSITIISSGSKEADLGGHKLVFRKGTLFVLAVDLPDSFVVRQTEEPDLTSISLIIKEDVLQHAIEGFSTQAADNAAPVTTLEADSALVSAFRRLLEAHDHPAGEALQRLAAEEILLRVLATPAGPMLKRLYAPSSVENRIRRSVSWMQNHYREDFDVSSLAANVGMSEATYYRHFKKVINISPRQYIKNLRLHHAHRLMIDQKFDATQAAFEVGYKSPNHFTREFKRMFGDSPKRFVTQETATS